MLYFTQANIFIQAFTVQVPGQQQQINMRKTTQQLEARETQTGEVINVQLRQLTFTHPNAASLPLATWADECLVCDVISQWGKVKTMPR